MKISNQTTQQQQQQINFFDKLKNKPFWIWNIEEHKLQDIRTKGDCCFNHIVGLPKKNGKEFPMFDYQKTIYDTLLLSKERNDFRNKHLWVKKATGLGVTEFFLRLIAWLCLRNDDYQNSQVCIVTGPNIDISIKLIRRLKALFEPHSIYFQTKETILQLNGCHIEAFPSHHLDSFRALQNPKFIFLDEADFFAVGQQAGARNVSERYIAKSDPSIVMISTPNAPGGLFEAIEKETENVCIYKRLKLDYTYGLDRIYTREEIDKAKTSPSFEREYNLKYLGRVGNVFHSKDIDNATSKKYDLEYVNPATSKSMGIDPGWGSSAFAVVVTQFQDGEVQVLEAIQWEKVDFNEVLKEISTIITKYDPTKIYIDGANPSFIRSLKLELNEDPEYEKAIEYYNHTKCDWTLNMRALPVSFAKENKAMLGNCKMILESGLIAIDPRFDKKAFVVDSVAVVESRLQIQIVKDSTDNLTLNSIH
jgi:terminase large subunit-like protein